MNLGIIYLKFIKRCLHLQVEDHFIHKKVKRKQSAQNVDTYLYIERRKGQ